MAHELFDEDGNVGAHLSGATLAELFTSATAAFAEAMVRLDRVEPRQADEIDIDAPDLDELLVDYLSELLYRFDARGWLTCRVDLEVSEKDGGWTLEGALRGERIDAARHGLRRAIAGVTYRGLHVRQDGARWVADVLFEFGDGAARG